MARSLITAVACLLLLLLAPATVILWRAQSYVTDPANLVIAADKSGLFVQAVPTLVEKTVTPELIASAGLAGLTVEQVDAVMRATFPAEWLRTLSNALLVELFVLQNPGEQLADRTLVIPLRDVKARFTAALHDQLAGESPLASDLPACSPEQLLGLSHTLESTGEPGSLSAVLEGLGCWPQEVFGAQAEVIFLPGGLPVSPKILAEQFPDQLNLLRFVVPTELPVEFTNDLLGLRPHDRPLSASERSALAPLQASVDQVQQALNVLQTLTLIAALGCLGLVALVLFLHHKNLAMLLLWVGIMSLLLGIEVLLLGLLPGWFAPRLIERGFAAWSLAPAGKALLQPLAIVYARDFFRWFSIVGGLASATGLICLSASGLLRRRESPPRQ
jgi:hypothetical protein